MSDLECDLSQSLKVKCHSAMTPHIYAYLLMFNSNIWLNAAPLRNIRLRNLSDIEFDLSRSLKVIRDDVIGVAIMVSY